MNEDKQQALKIDIAIENGLVCTDCMGRIEDPYQKSPSQCADCYDPSPCCWAHGQGALSSTEPCPEIAAND